METILRWQQQLSRMRRLPVLGVAVAVAILGGTIYFGTQQLRQKIRHQIAGRDAAVLHAVALMQQLNYASDEAWGDSLDDLSGQFAVTLEISQLTGVIAARLFDAEGNFAAAFPAYVTEASLPDSDLRELQRIKPVSRFHPQARLADQMIVPAEPAGHPLRTVPLLEVNIPLHRKGETRLLGITQFIIDGQGIAAEFAALDRNLFVQAALAFLAGGALLAVSLGWAFRRLQKTSRLLVDRTRHLMKANEELALAAKTSAVGAVAAHLIHGLNNPLADLRDFVASRAGERPAEDNPDWQDAIATTRRMQTLVGEVVRVLNEEQRGDRYEITLAELAELVAAKVEPVARRAGVHFEASMRAAGALANRDANLVLLILENLLRNAVEATPPGKSVRLTFAAEGSGVRCEVRDEGPGVPPALQPRLFTPCRSTKEGGSGIGLAICKQLANHLGAALDLQESTPRGSVFVLQLPGDKFGEKALLASEEILD